MQREPIVTLCAALAILAAPVPVLAQGTTPPSAPEVTHLSAADLRALTDSLAARAAREPGRQVPGRPLGRDSVLAMFLLRRDTSGRPERHDELIPLLVFP